MALSSVVLLYGEITISDIDRLVNDIKMEREGLKEVEIQKAKDPFIYPNGKYRKVLQSAASKSKRKYRFYLTAIINDSVKINNRWYRLNSKINGYKVSKVGKNYVLLTKNSERVRVFLKHPKSKKIKLIVK
ncbi:MAG: hypothetical protein L3J42_00530 [Hydrogenimonas sp.]|nr:hypothetical protein [Hydrogenimonas sp.]